MARLLLVVFVAGAPLGLAQQHVIDFRYSPEYSFTPICFVDDWQKTMVDNQGGLLYDFGPGPYVRPNTIVSIGAREIGLVVMKQRLENPHVPIVLTELSGKNVRMNLESFAIVPRAGHTSKEPAGLSPVKRFNGLNGALAWAQPPGQVDEAFRNVAWGTNRPIVYAIDVERGSSKKVALGFCESYRRIPGLRMTEIRIEGSDPTTIDLLANFAQNQPQVVFVDGRDENSDGILNVELRPSAACRDPNIILNGIWLFPSGAEVTVEDVISGRASARAEVFVDCGRESDVQRQPTRIDAIRATIQGKGIVPVIRIRTHRQCTFDATAGVLLFDGRPFVSSRPKATSAVQTTDGWELQLPRSATKVELIAISGYRLPKTIAEVPDLRTERSLSVDWWSKNRYPKNKINVPDKNLQFLLDAGMRTLYQLRDTVDGVAQFQPGSTVYRGLWIHDAVYDIDVALMEGDTLSARKAVEGLFQFQDSTGRVQVMWPVAMQRETPHFIWLLCRYAQLTNDREWLKRQWPRIFSGMNYIRRARTATMTDSQSPSYGLLPPGFIDGGVPGVSADYSSVYWALIATDMALEGARWLGQTREAASWQTLRNDLFSSFRKTAGRDVRTDQWGNQYLTAKVADTTNDVPQRGQWVLCEAVNLGSIFPENDPIVRGTLAILDSSCVQGLPVSFGWLTGGIGVWFAPLYGLAHFEAGDISRAHDILYAFANHATPLGAWAEEQMPKGQGPRTTGDFPTNSAYVGMLKLVISLLVDDHGGSAELLRGIPTWWLTPGSVTEVNDLLTKFGHLSISIRIAPSGRDGSIRIRSQSHANLDEAMAQYTDATAHQVIFLEPFRRAGFTAKDGSELPPEIKNLWGHDMNIEFKKTGVMR